MVNYLSADLVLDARAQLGESPRWDLRSQRLLWLDIDGELLHVTDPAAGYDETIAIGGGVGALAPGPDGGVAFARRDGFFFLDPETSGPRAIASIPSADDEIMNDGLCDPAGRFWAGTYAEGERPGGGRLYRLGLDGSVDTVLAGVTLSNGLGWSPDHSVMYYIDSPTQGVDAFGHDVESGEIAERRRVVTIPPADGMPDGLAVDDDGAIWVGLWGGGELRRYPPTGSLDCVVPLPAATSRPVALEGATAARCL